MSGTIEWEDSGLRGTTPVGHRVTILRNKASKTQVISVDTPVRPGQSITTVVTACDDPDQLHNAAEQLVAQYP